MVDAVASSADTPWEVADLDRLLAAPARPEPTYTLTPPGGGKLIGFGGGVPDAPDDHRSHRAGARRAAWHRERHDH
jgi:hypothetical protein